MTTPTPDAIAAELTPVCRGHFWEYRRASAQAQDDVLWLMCASDMEQAAERAAVCALSEQRAQLLFTELRSALIRSRPGGFDPLDYAIEVSETDGTEPTEAQ